MMNKIKFIQILEQKLKGLPDEDITKTIEYWDEIICDKVDDGMKEEEVIASLNVDEIVEQAFKEIPLSKLIKQKVKGKNRWSIAFWISTFYIWLPILISLIAVLFTLYICLWVGVVSFGAVGIASEGVGLFCIISGIVKCFTIDKSYGWLFIGLGITAIGLGILFTIFTIKLTKWLIVFTKKILLWTKLLFVRRGEKNEV